MRFLSTVPEADVEERLAASRRARATSAVALLQKRSVQRGLDKMRPGEIEPGIANFEGLNFMIGPSKHYFRTNRPPKENP